MIKLVFENAAQIADMVRSGGNLETGDSLRTAVLISLFTWRVAEPGDVLPTRRGTRQGWWADFLAEIPGDKIGSRLWLLGRAKTTARTLRLARQYAAEALEWMTEDGVASSIEVTSERLTHEILAIRVKIQRPEAGTTRWEDYWIELNTEALAA